MPATTKTALRRLTLGALLTGGIWLGLTALDGAAHADDTAPAVQQSRGLLDDLTGTVGSVVEVVDQVVPDPPKSEQATEPATESESSEEADHGTDEQQAAGSSEDTTPDPLGDVLDGIGQVLDPVTDIVETVTAPLKPPATPSPAPTTPAPAPVVTPAPTQTASPAPAVVLDAQTTIDEDPADEPAADETPAVEHAPAGLPVPIGPVAGRGTLIADDSIRPAQADAPAVEVCDGKRAIDLARDALRMVVSNPQQTTPDRAAPREPADPCPQPGDTGTQAATATAGGVHTGHQGDHHATSVTGLLWPALERLHQLRARGDLPAGRCPHLDPGPA